MQNTQKIFMNKFQFSIVKCLDECDCEILTWNLFAILFFITSVEHNFAFQWKFAWFIYAKNLLFCSCKIKTDDQFNRNVKFENLLALYCTQKKYYFIWLTYFEFLFKHCRMMASICVQLLKMNNFVLAQISSCSMDRYRGRYAFALNAIVWVMLRWHRLRNSLQTLISVSCQQNMCW